MKILALGKPLPGVTQEKMYALVKDEAGAAWKLYGDGLFREVYMRPDGGGVVVIMESPSADEAKKVLDTLPMVKGNITSWEVIPLGPFMPFSALFAQK